MIFYLKSFSKYFFDVSAFISYDTNVYEKNSAKYIPNKQLLPCLRITALAKPSPTTL